MKVKMILTPFLTIILCLSAWAWPQFTVRGVFPGELYMVGPTPHMWGCPVFYYSSDGGETLEARDSCQFLQYGLLLPDSAANTLYNMGSLLTTDGGFHWHAVNDSVTGMIYTSGICAGEIYRHAGYPILNQIERSTDYGQNYTPCATQGITDGSGICDLGLGSAPGEVYAVTSHDDLFYSGNYGEHFNFLVNLYHSWGIPGESNVINGIIPGEIYIFLDSAVKHIWRIYNYGAQMQVVGSFPLGYSWYSSPAPTDNPGELYFTALYTEMLAGGLLRIYHTTNYGQSWDYIEHDLIHNAALPWSTPEPQPNALSLQVFPNPANGAFSTLFHLPTRQKAQIGIFNFLGQKLKSLNSGVQLPGNYQMTFSVPDLPSGTYIVRLQTNQEQITSSVTIIK
jgi:hypothetical protein